MKIERSMIQCYREILISIRSTGYNQISFAQRYFPRSHNNSRRNFIGVTPLYAAHIYLTVCSKRLETVQFQQHHNIADLCNPLRVVSVFC